MTKRTKSEKIDVDALRAALAAAELRADQATERADGNCSPWLARKEGWRRISWSRFPVDTVVGM